MIILGVCGEEKRGRERERIVAVPHGMMDRLRCNLPKYGGLRVFGLRSLLGFWDAVWGFYGWVSD